MYNIKQQRGFQINCEELHRRKKRAARIRDVSYLTYF